IRHEEKWTFPSIHLPCATAPPSRAAIFAHPPRPLHSSPRPHSGGVLVRRSEGGSMCRIRAVGLGVIATLSLLLSSCFTLMPLADALPEFLAADDAAEVRGPLDVRGLACEIDCLEKQIEKYGTVVPKHADVWGQARLMMHRQEFEREMRKDVGRFDE